MAHFKGFGHSLNEHQVNTIQRLIRTTLKPTQSKVPQFRVDREKTKLYLWDQVFKFAKYPKSTIVARHPHTLNQLSRLDYFSWNKKAKNLTFDSPHWTNYLAWLKDQRIQLDMRCETRRININPEERDPKFFVFRLYMTCDVYMTMNADITELELPKIFNKGDTMEDDDDFYLGMMYSSCGQLF
jgi:hypothetical protein